MAHKMRPWHVDDQHAGQTLAAVVRGHLGLSWSKAKKLVQTGKVSVDGARCADIARRVHSGQSVAVDMNAPRPRDPAKSVLIVHEDRHVVVIDKPAGVMSVPYQAQDRDTAMDLLRAAWRRTHSDAGRVPVHVVHRIDKATSGLLAFAKSKRAELGMAAQLRAHTMEREYLCVVHGRAVSGQIESRLVRDRGDGLRGSARHPGQGKRAVTHVVVQEVLENLPGRLAASFCSVRLETGKTHQIRIHLAERGHPLVGEPVYIRDFVAAEKRVVESPRLLLHAHTLGFEHPITGRPVACRSPLPDDYRAVVERLRSLANRQR